MKPRHRRAVLIVAGVAVVGVAAALVLTAFRKNMTYFYTPTEVIANKAPVNRLFRVGGLVENGSLKREGVRVTFRVTDTASTITVAYDGILPDLFREGKGVGAQGRVEPAGRFRATQVLPTHATTTPPPIPPPPPNQPHNTPPPPQSLPTY